ncbi:uncharacterized protein LOC100573422 [Acyrthosiphon pisum]|uniref:C2H2-type domain-containing protein n=1 Tax=Acyrthosiphon pisum TaxID=7029 RepID=A0A8R1W5I1_ACYPI|nr:uncharacterized protein LOC100573422 [Acyrthosiphon pisum]|eukprot:XP_003244427.1 PREDICTED: uncharacterized protein LOC100573422 isoform X2 [Acyrthosiphon pisum]
MGVCFLCDKKLDGRSTQVCSSRTSYSNVPFPEKIAEFMGDEVVVIVTTADHMCKKCTAHLNHIDELENVLKLVKNAFFSCIQKKYGILPPDQAVKSVEIVNRHLKAEEQLEQRKVPVPSSLRVRVSPAVTTAAVITPVQTPLKLLKTQHKQQQQRPPTQQKRANLMKEYKCTFCGFQSKELGRVRFHLRTTHGNNKEPEKPILNQTVANALTMVPQQKEQIYRCQVCSKTFDCQINCLDHIQKDHNQPTPSTSTGERETEDSCLVKTKAIKLEPSKTQENNHQADSMDVDENQKDDKSTVNMDMMFNDYFPTQGSADVKQEKDNEKSQKYKPIKEAKWKIKPEPAQEETSDEENEENKENITMIKQEEANQKTPYVIKKEVKIWKTKLET